MSEEDDGALRVAVSDVAKEALARVARVAVSVEPAFDFAALASEIANYEIDPAAMIELTAREALSRNDYTDDEKAEIEKHLAKFKKTFGELSSGKATLERKSVFSVFADGIVVLWHALLLPDERQTLMDAANEKRRKAGGETTGSAQSSAAQAEWEPWQKRFVGLMKSGKTQADARHIVATEREKAGLPASDRTIRKWLVAKKVGTQL